MAIVQAVIVAFAVLVLTTLIVSPLSGVDGAAVVIACPGASPLTVGDATADYTLSGCTALPGLIVTVTAAKSFTVSGCTIASLQFTSAFTISSFALVISSSRLASSTNHLVAFASPLYQSSISIVGVATTLAASGGFRAVSVASQSQELTIMLSSATISSSTILFSMAGGLFGSANVISLVSVTLTGAGPAFYASNVFSAQLTQTSGGSISLVGPSGSLVSVAGSLSGFTFLGYATTSTISYNGNMVCASGDSLQTSVSIIGAVGLPTWTIGTTAGVVSMGGASTQFTFFAEALTLNAAYAVQLVGQTRLASITFAGVKATLSSAAIGAVQFGAAASTLQSATVTFTNSVAFGVALGTLNTGYSVLVTSGNVATLTVSFVSVDVKNGASSTILLSSTLGNALIATSAATITSSNLHFVYVGAAASDFFQVAMASTVLSTLGAGFYAAAPLGSNANTFQFTSCTITAQASLTWFLGIQPHAALTMIDTTFSVTESLLRFGTTGGIVSVALQSSSGTCGVGSCIRLASSVTSLTAFFGKLNSATPATTVTATSASLISLVGAADALDVTVQDASVLRCNAIAGIKAIHALGTIQAVRFTFIGSSVVSATSADLIAFVAVTATISAQDTTFVATSGELLSIGGTSLAPFKWSMLRATLTGRNGITIGGSVATGSTMQWEATTATVTIGNIVHISGLVSGLQLALYTTTFKATAGSGFVAAGSSITFSAFTILDSSISTFSSCFLSAGDVVASIHGTTSTLTSSGLGVFALNSASIGHQLDVVWDRVKVENSVGAAIYVVGLMTRLTLTMATCTIGSAAPLGSNLVVLNNEATTVSMVATATSVTTAGSLFAYSSIVGTSFLSMTTVTYVGGSLSSGVGVLSVGPHQLYVTASTIRVTANAVVFCGGLAVSLTCSIVGATSITANTGGLLSLAMGGTSVALVVSAAGPIDVAANVLEATGGFTSSLRVTMMGAAASSILTVSCASLFYVLGSTVQTFTGVWQYVDVTASDYSGVAYIGPAAALSSATLSISDATLVLTGGTLIADGGLTSVGLTFASSTLTGGVGGGMVELAGGAVTGLSAVFLRSTVAGTTYLFAAYGSGTLSQITITASSCSLSLTTVTATLGVVDFANPISNNQATVSLLSSTISITSAASFGSNPQWSLFSLDGGTHSAVTLKSISNTFAAEHTAPFFVTGFQLASSGIMTAPASTLEIINTLYDTSTEVRSLVLGSSGTSIASMGISVNCLSWDMALGYIVQLAGVTSGVSITLVSVALWKTASSAAIFFGSAASTSGIVVLYDTKLFASHIVQVASANNVDAITIGCSWHGNYPMRQRSFDTPLQAKTVEASTCAKSAYPSCWTTKTQSESKTISGTRNATVSGDTVTQSQTATPTASITPSGTPTISPSRNDLTASESSSATASQSISFSNELTLSRTGSATASLTLSVSSTPSPSSEVTESVLSPTLSETGSVTSSFSTSVSSSLTASASATTTASHTVSFSESSDVTLSASDGSPTNGRSATASVSLSVSLTPTDSITPSYSASVTTSLSVTPSATVDISSSGSVTESASVTGSSSVSLSMTNEVSASGSVSLTPSKELSKSPDSLSPTLSVTPSLSLTPSLSPDVGSVSPTESASPTGTRSTSASITPSQTGDASRTSSMTSSQSVTPTLTGDDPSASVTDSASMTLSKSSTRSSSASPDPSLSDSVTATVTTSASPSTTPSATTTATGSPSDSPTTTQSLSFSLLPSRQTVLLSASLTTSSSVGSATPSWTTALSASLTATVSPSRTPSHTEDVTPSGTRRSIVLTHSPSHTALVSATQSTSASRTASNDRSASAATGTVSLSHISGTSDGTAESTASTSVSLSQAARSRTDSASPISTISRSRTHSPSHPKTSSFTTTRRSKSRLVTPTRSDNGTSFTATNSTSVSDKTHVATITYNISATHNVSTNSVTWSERSSNSVGSHSFTRDGPTSEATSSRSDRSMTRSKTMPLSESRQKQPTDTHHPITVTVTPTVTYMVTNTVTRPSQSTSRSIGSHSSTSSQDITVTSTLRLTDTESVSGSVTTSLAVTRPTHRISHSATVTVSPSDLRFKRPYGAAVMMSLTITDTATMTVSSLDSHSVTTTLTESYKDPFGANLAAQRISDYVLITKSDCFKGTMAILLPMYGVIAAITLLHRFLITTNVAPNDAALRVTWIRNFAANQLYLGGLIVPCHRRCVVLHGVEIATHITVVLCVFALMFYVFDPPTAETRVVVAAAATVVATFARIMTSRVGWWYRGRPGLRLREKAQRRSKQYASEGSDSASVGSAVDGASDGYEWSPHSADNETKDNVVAIAAGGGGGSQGAGAYPRMPLPPSSTTHSRGDPNTVWDDFEDDGEPTMMPDGYLDDIDLKSLFDSEQRSKRQEIASLRDQDALDLMSLPASLFAVKEVSVSAASSTTLATTTGNRGNSSPTFSQSKPPLRRSSTWVVQPLAAVEEEVPSFGGSTSSVDIDAILSLAQFHNQQLTGGNHGPSHRGSGAWVDGPDIESVDFGYVATGKSQNASSPTSVHDGVISKPETSTAVAVAPLDGEAEDPMLNSYVAPYIVNGALLIAAFVGTFLLVSELGRQLQCDGFSASAALGVFVFDAVVVQTCYALLIGYSLWRNRSKKHGEHVWVLHPR